MTETVELKVLGQKLVLKSDADPARSRRVVEWVTQRVMAIEKRLGATSKTSVIPPMHVALLALLEIAQEYLDAKDRMEKHQAETNLIAKKLMQELQSRVSDNKPVPASPGLRVQGIKAQKSAKKKSRRGNSAGGSAGGSD